jgi:transposase-like protein
MTKKHCPLCLSRDIIKWGIRNNKQRYKCKRCHQFFVWRNKGKSLNRQNCVQKIGFREDDFS